MAAGYDRQVQATQAVTEALQAAQAAMYEWAGVAVSGGAKADAAFEEARIAVLGLTVAIEEADAVGATFGVTAIPALTSFEAKLAEAAAASEQLAAAERGEAAAANEAAAAKLKSAEASKLMSAEVGLARGNVGGLARAIGSLVSGPIAQLALAPLLIEAAFKLIPQLLKGIEDGTSSLGVAMGNLGNTTDKTVDSLDKQNKELAKAEQQVKKTADAIDLAERAQLALAAGIIRGTDNLQLLNLEYESHQRLLHGATTASEEYRKAVQAIGITLLANVDDLRAKETIFFNEYENLVQTRGIDVAKRWALEHKTQVQSIINESQAAGEALIPAFEKMADAVGIVSAAYEKNEKAIAGLQKRMEAQWETLKIENERLVENERQVNLNAEAKIRASEHAYAIVKKNLDAELLAIEEDNRQGLLSNEQYRQALADVQAKAVNDRRLHEAEIDVIRAAAELKIGREDLAAAISAEKIKHSLGEEATAAQAAYDVRHGLRQKEHEDDLVRDSELSISHQANLQRLKEHREAYAAISTAATAAVGITVTQLDILAKKLGTTTAEAAKLYAQIAGLAASPGVEAGTQTPSNPGGTAVAPGGI